MNSDDWNWMPMPKRYDIKTQLNYDEIINYISTLCRGRDRARIFSKGVQNLKN